jgi:hypothetical protein
MFTKATVRMVFAVMAIAVAAADNLKDQDEYRAIDKSKSVLFMLLAGTWVTDTYVYDGDKVIWWPGFKAYEIVLSEDGKVIETVLGNNEFAGSFQARLTQGANGQIDLHLEGKKLGNGIFRIVGTDTLRLCLDCGGKGRPGDFECKKGSGRLLVTLKRVKP